MQYISNYLKRSANSFHKMEEIVVLYTGQSHDLYDFTSNTSNIGEGWVVYRPEDQRSSMNQREGVFIDLLQVMQLTQPLRLFPLVPIPESYNNSSLVVE